MEPKATPSAKSCTTNSTDYCSLEPGSLSSLGVPSLGFSSKTPMGLYDVTSTIITIMFVASVIAAVGRGIFGSFYLLEASEQGISKAKTIFREITFGLLGIFILFPLILLLNRQLLAGDVGVGLRGGGNKNTGNLTFAGGGASASVSFGSGGNRNSCETKETVISQLNSPLGACGNTSCKALTGCPYQQYLPIIEKESKALGVDPKMVIVTLCKESSGNKLAEHKNENGTWDCGLMQINQSGVCTDPILNPEENIKQGISLLKKKISATTQIYQKIPPETGVFASYNCCSNKTIPNDPSSDCTTESGFPYPIPKWACPINPGESSSNMCSVKKYVCELSACLKQL